MSSRNDGNYSPDTKRLEAFSDGVFAVAITLLIFQIKMPTEESVRQAGGLRTYLGNLWPSYVAYGLSFVTIGVYWANHHYLFRLVERNSHGFIMANVVLLMAISFIPYPTAVLGDLYLNDAERATAVSFYAFSMWLAALCWLGVWLFAQNRKLTDPRLSPAFVKTLTRQYLTGNVFYLVALVTSFFSTMLSLIVTFGLTILYTMPPRKPEYQPEIETKKS